MSKGVRRIVTGHRDDGEAVVIIDEQAVNIFHPPGRPGVQINNVWRQFEAPADLGGNADNAAEGEKIGLEPGANGSVFRVIEFPPEGDWIDSVDREAAKESFKEFGSEHAADSSETPAHPLMHRTETIDYAVIMSGEIVMVMDKSEVLCREGDVVVQRGTNHAWANRSDQPCRIAFILIDGKFS
jgi:mannose-6-phosphate isomerase-like protein (cupin superfamily)